jgi:DNA-binding transcriptional LysR family regulator
MLTPTELNVLVRLNDGMTQSEAGADLGLEQPSISKILRAAELRIGLPLLQQEGRRSRLTSVGRELALAGAVALRRLNGLDDFVQSLRAGHAGVVRLIASTTPGSYMLPPLLASFLRANPQANVEVDVVSMTRLWPVFAAGGYDLAIVPRVPFAPDLVAEPLYDDPIVFFAAPGAPITQRAHIKLEDLANETMVGVFSELFWGQIHHDLARRGYAWRSQIDLRSSEAIKRLVEAGMGTGILFESSVAAELADGRLVRVPIHDAALVQTFCIVRRAESVESPIARDLSAHLHEALRGVFS